MEMAARQTTAAPAQNHGVQVAALGAGQATSPQSQWSTSFSQSFDFGTASGVEPVASALPTSA
eukprot:3941668-Prymnesium_polylepis.1